MKRLEQKATDTEWAIPTLKTCISNMLRPTKHLLYIESEQTLTFVPDRQAQHNCTADPRDSGQAPRKTNSPRAKTFTFTWKSYRKGRGCKVQFSSRLRHETASPSAYNRLPHSHHLFSLLPSRGAAPPWRMHLWFITRAGQEGWWRITSRQTPSSHTGPAQPDEPGIFTTAEHFALQMY